VARKDALAAVCAGLALALSACGGDSGSAADLATLNPPVDPQDQLEWGEHTARIGGISAADVAAAAAMSVYPPDGGDRPSSWFLVRDDRWTDAVIAAQFATKPIYAGLGVIDKEYLPTPTVDLLRRVTVTGFPKGKGLEAAVLGEAGTDVFLGLKDGRLKATQLQEPTPAELAEKVVPFHGGGTHRYSTSLVVASAEESSYALPAAAWSAYSGDTLVLVDRDEVPAATRRVVAQREKLTLERPAIYVIGPEDVISESVVEELSAYGDVKRVAGDSAVETAIALARYRDPETLFGWGLRRAPANFSLVNEEDWGDAVGAFTFAATGPQAPLLLTDSAEELAEPVENYLDDLRGAEPSHGFVFGDRESISSAAFMQFDEALAGR
jgi:putative cell wall binding repeat protein